MIETKNLKIYVASQNEMESFIKLQTDDILKAAYTEMLNGCLENPEQWEWYAIWMIVLKDGTHIGELCFKGLNSNGIVEIGYGILKKYQGKGYATEAVKAISNWAFQKSKIFSIEAETDDKNIASKKVLEKCGFVFTGKNGKEGLLYKLTR
jgi:RimJ/RimL family protein N-acetyltransferase